MKDAEIENKNIMAYVKDNYINSTMNPQFAILIKGEWGCGKTFLVKEILKDTYGDNYKDKVVWISVYGLSSIQQLRRKLYEKIHPILTHKITKFALDTVKAGIKATTSIDLNNDGEDDYSFEVTIPNIENGEDKIKIKKILIVDDIERCSIPMSEFLGFFSEEILEKNLRAIFISNDKIIKQLDESKKDNDIRNEYNSIKEKIIGMEFEVKPDIHNAIKTFIKEIGLEKKEAILLEKSLEVLSNLQFANLRSVRQAFVHLSQIFLPIKEIDIDEEYISKLVEYFLVLYVQKSKGDVVSESDFLDAIEAYAHGKLSFKDYTNNSQHRKNLLRYARVPLKKSLFNIICKGDFSSKLIIEDYKSWTSSESLQSPYQKLRTQWFNYSDSEFLEYYTSVQSEFDNNKIQNPFQIIGWANLKFELSEQEIITESIEEIKQYFIEYIKKNKDKLEPYNIFIPLQEKFTRCKNREAALCELETQLKNINQELIEKQISNHFIELYSNTPLKIRDLSIFISYEEKNIAILKMVDINDFYQKMKKWNYSQKVTVLQSFEERYGKNKSTNFKKEYYPDIEKVASISKLYGEGIESVTMSPETAQRKWLSDWYKELYEYMYQSYNNTRIEE